MWGEGSLAFFWLHRPGSLREGMSVVPMEPGIEALGLLGWSQSPGWLSWLLPTPVLAEKILE